MNYSTLNHIDNKIQDEGVEAFIDGLKQNRSITKLSFESKQKERWEASTATFKSIFLKTTK